MSNPGVTERDLRDCAYGCGMRVVWAPVAANGGPRTFNPELCDLAPDVWLLRRSRGMVPCSTMGEAELAALRGRGLRGWRAHTCAHYAPGARNLALPGKLNDGGML